jgi:hypothetical protein
VLLLLLSILISALAGTATAETQSCDKVSFEAVMMIAKQCCRVLYIGRVLNVNCSSGDIPSNVCRGLGDRCARAHVSREFGVHQRATALGSALLVPKILLPNTVSFDGVAQKRTSKIEGRFPQTKA